MSSEHTNARSIKSQQKMQCLRLEKKNIQFKKRDMCVCIKLQISIRKFLVVSSTRCAWLTQPSPSKKSSIDFDRLFQWSITAMSRAAKVKTTAKLSLRISCGSTLCLCSFFGFLSTEIVSHHDELLHYGWVLVTPAAIF